MKKDVECPYCEQWQEICHDDGFGYEEDKAHEMECSDCGKNFVFHTSISFDYEPSKADCLNGSPHNLTDWKRCWEHEGTIHERRGCRDCDHSERRSRPTQEKGGAE